MTLVALTSLSLVLPAMAQERLKLRSQSASKAVSQIFPIFELAYDAAGDRIIVDSEEGNRRCADVRDPVASDFVLELDDVDVGYPLALIDSSRYMSYAPSTGDVTVQIEGKGGISTCSPDFKAISGFGFTVAGQANEPAASLAENVLVDNALPATELKLRDPVLCNAFDTGTGIDVTLVGPNELGNNGTLVDDTVVPRAFKLAPAGAGVQSASLSLTSTTLSLTPATGVQCLVAPPAITPAAAVAGIFSNSFEDGTGSGGNKTGPQVGISIVSGKSTGQCPGSDVASLSDGQVFSYRIAVENTGDAEGTVSLREFVPVNGAFYSRAHFSLNDALPLGAPGTQEVSVTVPAGGRVTVPPTDQPPFERTVVAPNPPADVALTAAAFGSGGGDIVRCAVNVVDNQTPTVSPSGPLSMSLDEDADPSPLGTTLSADDPDGDNTQLAWSVGTAPSKGTATVTGTGTSTSSVTYEPDTDANGSDSFTVRVTDDSGASTDVTVDVTINAVNDAPSFNIAGDQTHPADTADPFTITDWLTSAVAGPDNESGQTLTYSIKLNPDEPAPPADFFFGSGDPPSGFPELLPGGDGTADLDYIVNGVSGTAHLLAEVSDGTDTASKAFRIVVGDAPVISGVAPERGSTVSGLSGTDIAVTFDKAVTGVDRTDLLVGPNDVAAAAVSASSDGTTYTFTLPTTLDLADGDVSVTLAQGGITDEATGSAFAGESWTYTLDTLGPSVTNATLLDATDEDGLVKGGDSVTVSATVTDTNGVVSVSADASAFGVGEVALTDGDGDDVYDATFTVKGTSAAADGDHSVTLTAEDALGNTASVDAGPLTLDTTAPTLGKPSVNADTLTLPYDESLDTDTGSVPATSDYTVMVNGNAVELSGVAVEGSSVILTLASAVVTGDDVTVSYVKGNAPVRDVAGNEAGAFDGVTATNNT